MVVLVDLDDSGLSGPPIDHPDSADGSAHHFRDFRKPVWPPKRNSTVEKVDGTAYDDRPNPNLNGFSAALSCYP